MLIVTAASRRHSTGVADTAPKRRGLPGLLTFCVIALMLLAATQPSVAVSGFERRTVRDIGKHSKLQGRSANLSPLELARRQNKKVSPLCQEPSVRKEWFSLTEQERQDWLQSFKRLTMPGNSVLLQGGSVIDDFVAGHIYLNQKLHFNGGFLPWHCALLNIFNKYMRLTGYKGPEVYIDVFSLIDGKYLPASDAFGAQNFGGDGKGGSIPDGIFAKMRGNISASSQDINKPIYFPVDITRNFQKDWLPNSDGTPGATMVTTEILDDIFKHCDYETYRPLLEQLPHGSVHAGIAGTMSLGSSPNDAFFWVLHGTMDWVWRSLQEYCGGNYYDYSGPRLQVAWNGEGPGKNGPRVSLDDKIDFVGLVTPITVRDVMHPREGINCYTYDSLYVPGGGQKGGQGGAQQGGQGGTQQGGQGGTQQGGQAGNNKNSGPQQQQQPKPQQGGNAGKERDPGGDNGGDDWPGFGGDDDDNSGDDDGSSDDDGSGDDDDYGGDSW